MRLDTGTQENVNLLDHEATRARLDALLAEDDRLAARQTDIDADRIALKNERAAIGDRRGKIGLAIRHCRTELGEAREPRADAGTKKGKRTPAQAPAPATEEVPSDG